MSDPNPISIEDIEILWKRRGNRHYADSDGGYLLPPSIFVPRPGFVAWLLRLMNKDAGWKIVNPLDILLKARDLANAERKTHGR